MAKEENSQVLPVALGIGVVVTTFVLYRLYSSKSEKKGKGKAKKVLLEDPQAKYKIPLVAKTVISHDTRNFRFGLPSKEHVLGLPVGQHVQLSARVGDDLVIRSYTPVSSDDDHGYVDFVIKVYFKNVHPKFPDGGVLTQYIESLKIGDTIDIRGPSGRIQYVAPGTFSIKKMRKDPPTIVKVGRVNLIAGGVGITPILQLIRQIAKDDRDVTEAAILFANQTEQDILLREELEEVRDRFPNQFKLWYTLDKPAEGWKYSSGFINEDMLREHLFPASDDTVTLMCGPPPMINFACVPNLEKLGHKQDRIFAY
ncbi:NADH-cytochrome b5 reductase 3 isoform X2 [Cylas formicarius]|uniref:NADH-cytochrome b5 reductase 3 isoform X2 n=1 Tax=Cylas formicarius TaxID=197179 RepID=UPI00295864D3|nr:NADH-cytochrome b5 reductase 3 isoform X2 [Cylas formicarius]